MLRSNIQYFCMMRFRIKATLSYDVYAPSTCVFNIQALGNSTNQSIILEALEIEPILPFKSLRYLIQKFDLLLYKLLNLYIYSTLSRRY
jgi:hypothetical protein